MGPRPREYLMLAAVLMRVLSHTVSSLKNVTGVALERFVVKDRLHVDGSSGSCVNLLCSSAVLFNKLSSNTTAAWLQALRSAHHLGERCRLPAGLTCPLFTGVSILHVLCGHLVGAARLPPGPAHLPPAKPPGSGRP